MEYRNRLPSSQVYSTVPFPPPIYYDYYYPPPFDASYAPLPPPSAHGSSSSHAFPARMPYYRSRSEELPTGHNLSLSYQSHRDPFLERERQRIREEVMRDEVRRSILKEEVRWELEMERYYGLRRSSLGNHGTWPVVQFEQSRYSGGCYTKSSRRQVKRNCFKSRYWVRETPKRWVREIPHKIVEINEEEMLSKPLVSNTKVKPPNEEEIEKNIEAAQTGENGDQVVRGTSEIAHKIMEVTNNVATPPQALLKDDAQSPKSQVELRPTASLLEQAIPKDMTRPPPSENNIGEEDRNKVLKPENGNNIGKKKDGSKGLKPDNENKVEQHAFPKSSKKLCKEAGACGSKRKSNSISSFPNSATPSSSTDKVSLGNAKKQKTDAKMYCCSICHVTVYGDGTWLGHLNGKRHRRTLKSLADKNVVMKNGCISKEEVTDKKSTPRIELASVKVEMDEADSLVAEQASGELQTDKQIIKKMQVGHEVHEVVEKNNRLWCERCHYNCTSTVMMTIHLVSEKHKANCQK